MDRHHPHHEVSGSAIPDDSQRVLPLIGNDQIKLCVDARGAMHDFEARPSFAPPRIVWAGRRHDKRMDRYNSNLFEWGWLDLRLLAEDTLPAVTHWRQRLHPRQGFVETVIERGNCRETTTTFVHLERNLLVVHRRYDHLPAGFRPQLEAVYTLQDSATPGVPFRVQFAPQPADTQGIEAQTVADGHRVFRGRIALFTDQNAAASSSDNTLRLLITPADGASVTVYLSLEDDLGDDPLHYPIFFDGWMSPDVKAIHREHQQQRITPGDPATATRGHRAWCRAQGFDGVLASQRAAWQSFWNEIHIQLPGDQPAHAAAFETAVYHCRCSATPWSFPANPFNSSWGAVYFWDECFPFEGLLALGVTDLAKRVVEWRRAMVPYGTMLTGGRGCRYMASVTETGVLCGDRNVTGTEHQDAIGWFVQSAWQFCQYVDDASTWARFYPIIRQCAEYYLNWILEELPGNVVRTQRAVDLNEAIYPQEDGPMLVVSIARTLDLAVQWAQRLDVNEPRLAYWKEMADRAYLLTREVLSPRMAEAYRRRYGKWTNEFVAYKTDEAFSEDNFWYVCSELRRRPQPDMQLDRAIADWRQEQREKHLPFHQLADGGGNVGADESKPEYWPWQYQWQAHAMATLGRAEDAMRWLDGSLQVLAPFACMVESASKDLSRIDHPWLTTSGGAYLRAVARMLMYPYQDEIHILPGITQRWSDLSYELPAHGGVRVAIELRGGQLVRLELSDTKQQPRPCRLIIPRRFLAQLPPLYDNVTEAETSDDLHTLSLTLNEHWSLFCLEGVSA
ncbi:MAG: hypothetical protein IT440_11305 [Phycisphaeraceae bacterium]|nr:hypothetical protein [Phycisphaeraceae bacterium]